MTSHARPDLECGPLRHTVHTAVGQESTPRAPVRRHAAAAWQPSKARSKAASHSFLPRKECSLRPFCAVDEWHGRSAHSSTLREQVRAGKRTWVSWSVGQHSAAAPALVRARIYLSAARFATLLPARRLATPATSQRNGVRTRGLKPYSERVAPAIGIQVCSLDSDGPRSERGRKSDLRQNASFSQILPTYVWTLPGFEVAALGARAQYAC